MPGKTAETPEAVFPTFFMGGFECSTFLWKDGKRKNYLAETGHDTHFRSDFAAAMDLGIGVVREGIPWPMVDRGSGVYDWSQITQVQEAATEYRITPVWDLFHYGLPDGCDPFSSDCRQRFVDYCRAAAELITSSADPPYFFTPVNEITFLSSAATDLGWMYPFAKGRSAELKRALCRMAIEGTKAIRSVAADARIVHVDPMIHAVAPPDKPELTDEAREKEEKEDFEAFDILSGHRCPELGGSPEILDVVGVNIYHYSQVQLEGSKREILGPRDPRRKTLSEMLAKAWQRYRRPLIIGETSGFKDNRAEWLRMTVEESLKALNAGVDLQGVCLFPFVDMPDWWTGEWANIGVYDISNKTTHERVACGPYVEELRRWQELLDQPNNVEPQGYGDDWGRVQLDEIRSYARKWANTMKPSEMSAG